MKRYSRFFLDSEKTFVENITRKAKKSFFFLLSISKKISFLSIGKDEAVVLVVRQHWSGLIPKICFRYLL
jgi:hypothetical protein